MKKLTLFLIGLFFSNNSFAQTENHSMSDSHKRIYYSTLADAESKLLEYYEERKKEEDSNEYIGMSCLPYEMFKDLVIQDNRSFDYDFNKFKKASSEDDKTIRPLRIIKSQDNKIKLYTWDDCGGSMTNYSSITSIANDKIFSYAANKDEFGDDCLPEGLLDIAHGAYKIDCINNKDNETIYLIYSHYTGSSRMQNLVLNSYKLNGIQISSVPLFNGEKEVGFYFDPSNSYYTGITFQNNEITIPETRENNLNPYAGGICTGRMHVYKWNGTQFDYSGVTCNLDKKLFPQLKNFKYNVIQMSTPRYKIRIDKMPNNSFRYASWKINKECIEKPDIVIYNGFEDVEINEEDEFIKKFKYIFQNNGYFYIISWKSDYSNISVPNFVIKHNDKIILEEKL